MGGGIVNGLALSGGGVMVGAASGGGAATSGVASVGVGAICAIWGAVAAVACAVSKTCVVRELVSGSGGLSGLGAVCTGLAAAVLIASAPEETGAPDWLPVLKFSARSLKAFGPCAIAGAAAPAQLQPIGLQH